jgi:hypothetical protein
VFEVEGRGVSLWRNQRISFTVAGHLDTQSGSFELRKRHTGKYTNQVCYRGKIGIVSLSLDESGEDSSDERKALVFQLSGTYPNGAIHLQQRPGGVSALLETLLSSAVWGGASVSRTYVQGASERASERESERSYA